MLLVSYLNSFLLIKHDPEDVVKGKMVINQHRGFKKDKRGNRWEAEGEAEVDGT
jgi:hypothetical protein